MAKASTDSGHLIFSYGSNSTAQLRARVGNATLTTKPAVVHGWVRVFHHYAANWQGATASLARDPKGVVHGSIASLSDDERDRLDVHERGLVLVLLPTEVQGVGIVNAHAYVTLIPPDFRGLSSPFPSEQYLCAVSGMLREHWEELADKLVLRAIQDGSVVERGRWMHPGAVSSLQALAVEINLRLWVPWVMPSAATVFEEVAEEALGVSTAPKFFERVEINGTRKVAIEMLSVGEGKLKFDIDDFVLALEKVGS